MGFLNSLFGGAPTKYDALKYFDYVEKQKAKGNIVEALNYYAKVINHGDLGVKPFVPYIELCMEHDEWKKYVFSFKTETEYEEGGEALTPKQITKTIANLLPQDTIVATDVGQHQMWAIQHFHYDYPGQLLT